MKTKKKSTRTPETVERERAILALPVGTVIRLTDGREFRRYPSGFVGSNKLPNHTNKLMVQGDIEHAALHGYEIATLGTPSVGRPAKSPAERAIPVNTTLPPEVAAKLAESHEGSASRGLRAIAVEWAARK